MMVNAGFLSPTHPRAESHIRALAARLDAGQGHLIRRYLHPDGLGATDSTFTVCGFWYAEALARLGHQSSAHGVVERLLKHGNPLGLFTEDVDPVTGQPWGNFPQTYSHVGLIHAAFAIRPTEPELTESVTRSGPPPSMPPAGPPS